jgi:hypothetical protein
LSRKISNQTTAYLLYQVKRQEYVLSKNSNRFKKSF